METFEALLRMAAITLRFFSWILCNAVKELVSNQSLVTRGYTVRVLHSGVVLKTVLNLSIKTL